MITAKDKRLFMLLKELIRLIAGRNSEAILEVLFQKKNVNEFKIADKLGITINQARNILYRISSFNIMDSTRKKDKRKGWYTYFWTLNNVRALQLLEELKTQELSNMENLLKSRQTKNFYFCPNDNIEMSEETAMHYNFICPECGQLLQNIPKEQKIKEITSKIDSIKKEIDAIKEELERITPKPTLKIKKVKVKKKRVKKKKAMIKKKEKGKKKR
ncbi:MAG: hypothetical protein N3G19_03825 [Candidatus Pacearchaeota archaeon]|nr:hypothetical protein [Candidatus Pacearchaeota archaeon]